MKLREGHLKLALLLGAFCFVGLAAAKAHGKETWIEVSGVFMNNPELNYNSLYQSSAEFSKTCAMKSDRVCEKYMNRDPGFADDRATAQATGYNKTPDFKGPMEKQAFLDHLKDVVSHASGQDEIVIALEDHGTAAPPGQSGKSCVWINDYQCISEEDLRGVLALAHPGVKVAVVVDACYSGAFADLSSANTCVLTAADQHHTGATGEMALWTSIRSGQVKKLSDYVASTALDNYVGRLGSENMAANNCQSLRQKIAQKWAPEDLQKMENFFVGLARTQPRCENYKGASTVFGLSGIVSATRVLDFQSLIAEVCDPKEPKNADVCQQLQAAWERADSLESLSTDVVGNGLSDMFQRDLSQLTNRLAKLKPEEDLAVYHNISALMEPGKYQPLDLSTFSAADQKEMRQDIAKLKSLYDKYEKIGEVLLLESKNLPTSEAPQAMALRRCLLESSFEYIPPEVAAKPLRQFSPAEIQDAKKCESSFTF